MPARLVLCASLALCLTARAKDGGPSLAGYVESTTSFDWRKARQELAILSITRAQLRPDAQLGEHVAARITGIGMLPFGHTEFDPIGFLPVSFAASVVDSVRPVFELEEDFWLQEAWVGVHAGPVDLRLGRQIIKSGAGVFMQPTDLLVRRNPMDPTYEVEGFDAALVTVSLPLGFSIDAMYGFGTGYGRSRDFREVGDGDWMSRLKSRIGDWELTVQYTSALVPRTDWSGIVDEADPRDGRTANMRCDLIAGAVSGKLYGIGLHVEGGWAFVEDAPDDFDLADQGRDHALLLAGLDYTFSNGAYVLLEYQYDGQGRTSVDQYTLNDLLQGMTGERFALARDTVIGGARYPITERLSVQLYGFVIVADPAVFLNPWVVWTPVDPLTISFTGFVPFGSEDSSVGRAGAGGFVRLRATF